MAVQVICDNCGYELKGDDTRITLRMTKETTGDLIDMDLCVRCTKKYIAVLSEPV